MLGNKTNKNFVIKQLNTTNGFVTSSIDIANNLNDYFCNIGYKLNNDFPSNLNDFSRFMGVNHTCRFKFSPVSEVEIINIIDNFRNTGPGYDGLPMFLFKDNLEFLSGVITRICNKSLSSGVFPSQLTVARVTCIFKSGDSENPANYRPISLLSSFSKILEKIIEKQLNQYLYENNILTQNQCGFRRGRSTEHAIHTMVKSIHGSFNEDKFSVGIFLDIKKAFDSLDRNILLQKLKYYGIAGIEWRWFQSYLSDRRQLTMYNNCPSDIKRVDFGVPQGGIVSPLLFLVYINDIVNCSNLAECVLYADDTNLYMSSSSISDLFTTANVALAEYKGWFNANKLTLNAGKTQYMVFHRKQRTLPATLDKIYLNGVEVSHLEFVTETC